MPTADHTAHTTAHSASHPDPPTTRNHNAPHHHINHPPPSGATVDLCHSASWQVVEDRQSTHSSIAYQQYARGVE